MANTKKYGPWLLCAESKQTNHTVEKTGCARSFDTAVRCAAGSDIYWSVGPATLDESRRYMSVIPVSRNPERSRRGSRGTAPRPRERMLGSLHNRGSSVKRESRACTPQTARDPSASVGMTESVVDPTKSLLSWQIFSSPLDPPRCLRVSQDHGKNAHPDAAHRLEARATDVSLAQA